MKKFFTVIAAFLSPVFVAAQGSQIGKPALFIDSLKKVLPSLNDTARIDCLNKLGYAYIDLQKKDSSGYYANLAYEEAKKINYLHGIAVSFACKAQMAKHFDDDFVQSEFLGKESLYWYEQTGNKDGMGNAYNYLIYATFAQSGFDEAIDYAEKWIAFAKQTGDQDRIWMGLGWMFAIYRQSGDYEKSFLYAQQQYDLALKTKNKINISGTLYSMAQLYELIGDYPTALTYFRKVLQMDDQETQADRVNGDVDIWFKMEFTEAFSHLGQFDSAWYYYNLFKPAKDNEVYLRVYWVSTGECYYLQKVYHHALENLQLGLAAHRKLNDRNEIMRALLDIGNTYLALNKNEEALRYGREGLNIALQTRARQFIRDGYRILSAVYDRQHRTDSANFYFRLYTTIKDSVLNDQTKAKFAAYDYEQKIELVNKEKQIATQQLQINQQQLQEESLQKKILTGSLIALVVFGAILFRNIALRRKNEKHQRELAENELQIERLENEKTKTALLQQTTELEMQALRSQMNPHFIFNCLSSINRFILKNESETASDYLTKFSRLIRMVLNNSRNSSILLEDELEMLRLYLDLERLRFKNSFDYSIVFHNHFDVASIFIPPLLLQPFAENAIWHGLMHKEGRCLEVAFELEDNMLNCYITDNGIGRKKAATFKSKSAEKQKSLGMQITAGRLALLNNDKEQTFFDIEDLTDEFGQPAGTRVTLKIRYKETVEEFSRKEF